MKTCLFDIDGTIVQTGGAGQVAFAETFAAEFGITEMRSDVPFAGRSDRAIATDLMRAHGIDPTLDVWHQFKASYLTRLGPALTKCVGTVLPGVVELIEKLQLQEDILIGLLTGNVRDAAELKLSHYGVWEPFDFGGFGDEHPNRNDIAATAVAEARQRFTGEFNETLAKVVIIGDTPNDVTCARSVGAIAIAVPTGHTSADELRASEPDLLLPTLEDHDSVLNLFA